MKSRCVVVVSFVASSLLACGGTVDGEGGLPPSTGGSSSRGGASSTATGGSGSKLGNSRAGSPGGLVFETPPTSSGGSSNASATIPQAGALPMRDPNLPGVDFEDGSWIQLGTPTWVGSAGGWPSSENSGGATSGDPGPPVPK